jgi:twitching motility protein PilT
MAFDGNNDGEGAKNGRAGGNHNAQEIDKLFKAVIKLRASDLQLTMAKPPFVRVRGSLKRLNRGPVFDDEMARLCLPLMDEANRRVFEQTGGVEFIYSLPFEGNVWRFRVNVLRQSGDVGLVARKLPEEQDEGTG